MSKRLLLAGVCALILSLAVPIASAAQDSTVATMPYSVAAVQRVLNDLGYSAGPIDGLMGGKTRGAIRAYQADKGLPTSGEPSRSLYDHLQKTLMAGAPPAPTPGVDSSQIAEIQTRLRDRGYNVPYVSGTLDAPTVAAIRAYQGDAGLPVTGRATAALFNQLRIGNTSGASRPLARSEVVRIQVALNERGYAAGPEDGVAGPKVRAAIRTYQADAGLPATGEATLSLLAKLESTGDADNDVASGAPSGSISVAELERELQRRGYYVGDVDGTMDDQLRATIRTYQQDARLPVTGQVNAAFIESLNTSSVRNRGETNSLLVWEIENQLERRGYAVGTINGTVDEQARLAITTYQGRAGMRQDGRASFALLDHIKQTNARNDSQTASLLIWNIEKELTRLGYEAGPIDGTMDQQTAAGIRKYEEDAGLTGSGQSSEDLLASLESAKAQSVDQRDILEIERRLDRRGYAIGNPDGVVDGQTIAAIEAYQKDAGLVVTGRPSIALLQHLRSSGTVSRNYNSSGETVQQLIDTLRQAVGQSSGN